MIPIDVYTDRNIITCTIVPLIRPPELLPGQGEIQLSAFLSPANPGPHPQLRAQAQFVFPN